MAIAHSQSNSREPGAARALAARHLVALGILTCLAVATYSVLRAQIEAGSISAAVLNRSADQRTLLQRSGLLAHRLVAAESSGDVRAELLDVISRLELTHQELLGVIEHPTAPAKVAAVYFDSPWLLDTELRNFVAQSRSLALQPKQERNEESPHYRFVQSALASSRLLEGLDQVVEAYREHNQQRIARLEVLAGWLLVVSLLVLAATGFFVFWPSIRKVRDALDALHELNADLEQRVEQRTALAQHRANELVISETALLRQKKMLQSILNEMEEGVVVIDGNADFVVLNPQARRTFHIGLEGEAPRQWRPDWLKSFGLALFLPDTQQEYPPDRLPMARALRGESVDREEIVVRNVHTAAERWLSVSARPLLGDGAKIEGGVVVVRDITQRKLAERALERSEALYHSLVDNLPMCIVRKDLDGRFTFVNERFCEFVDLPARELFGKNDFDLFPEAVASAIRESDQRCLDSGETIEEIEDRALPTGERVYLEILKSPVFHRDGTVVGTQTAFWDVTVRKQAERQLRDMNVVLENAVEGICRVGPDQHYQAVNKTFADMLHCELRDLSDRSWLQNVHSDDLESVSQCYRQMRARGKAAVEANIVRPDGSSFPAELLLVKGETTKDGAGHYCFVRDITERRVAHEKGLRSERLAAIGQMVAGVAHESRNCLQQIQACADMLTWEIDGDSEAAELVADIQKAQERLHRLFDDLRGYASPLKLECRPTCVSKVLWEAWTAVMKLHPDKSALLKETSEAPRLSLDPFPMEQVFRNLFENSLAAAEGPVEITVEYTPTILNGWPADCIAVRDNGPGMKPEQLEKVFEPFYTTKTQGSGLGMSVCRRIVEAHGGEITAANAPTGGAEVCITLPREHQ